MAVVSQICNLVDALSNFQVLAMNMINGKFASLRRLMELLEKAADLTGFLPDISTLIPLYQIDTSLYENLRVECAFLNLPPSSGVSSDQAVGELRNQVNAAYAQILKQLNLHPYSQLAKLQDKLDDYQSRINLAALAGADFIQCLQAACNAATAVSNFSTAQVTKIATTYYQNAIVGQGKVLTAQAQAKVSTIGSLKTTMGELMSLTPPSTSSGGGAGNLESINTLNLPA